MTESLPPRVAAAMARRDFRELLDRSSLSRDYDSYGGSSKIYTLDLPWPRPPLNHNDRYHRGWRARIVASIRRDVGWLAKAAKIPHVERVTVQLHYAPGKHIRTDAMNWTATSKPAIDGLVDAKIVDDDDGSHVYEKTPEIHFPPEPGPRCWLTVEITQEVNT